MTEVKRGPFSGMPSRHAYRRASLLIEAIFGKIQTRGQGIPDEPAVFVATHRSEFDPPVLGKVIFDVKHEPMRYVAKQELFRFRPFERLITKWGAIPINREPGKAGAGLRSAIDAARDGQNVAIFAEGGIRNGSEVGEIFGGALAIAGIAKRPLVPVGIAGLRPLQLDRVALAFGETIQPDEARDLLRKKELGIATLRDHMQAAQDEAEKRDTDGRYYAVPILSAV